MMRVRCLLMAALLSWSVLPAHAEEGPPTTSPGVPAGPPYSSLLPQPAVQQLIHLYGGQLATSDGVSGWSSGYGRLSRWGGSCSYDHRCFGEHDRFTDHGDIQQDQPHHRPVVRGGRAEHG